MPNGNGRETIALWIRMLEAVEAGAKSNQEAIESASSVLIAATDRSGEAVEALSKATEGLQEHGSRLEELVMMRVSVERLQGEVRELQEESKASKVGKGDLLWKVLVGAFALLASALGGTLVSMLVK
jgi:hypothetical protein